jgi:mono/diheme cytochrome c family protein
MKATFMLFFISILWLVGMSYDGDLSMTTSPEDLISKEETTSSESFDIMMKVLTHQRCINCHPSGDRPHQGDDSHVHHFNVQRGEDNHGLGIVACSTCHQSENNNYSGVPGAPHWGLAPKSMAWEGLSRVEIAQVMLDPEKNGGRSVEEVEKHLTEDPLVLWAFDPGLNNEGVPREAPPVSKEDFFAAVKQWVAGGAKIPNE